MAGEYGHWVAFLDMIRRGEGSGGDVTRLPPAVLRDLVDAARYVCGPAVYCDQVRIDRLRQVLRRIDAARDGVPGIAAFLDLAAGVRCLALLQLLLPVFRGLLDGAQGDPRLDDARRLLDQVDRGCSR